MNNTTNSTTIATTIGTIVDEEDYLFNRNLIYVVEYVLPRIAALMSIICSSILIAEVLIDFKQKRRSGSSSNNYNNNNNNNLHRGGTAISKILFSVSVGDILFSTGWFLGTWASNGELWGDYGPFLFKEHPGNEKTCDMQGFLLQYGGVASLWSNLSLAVVFLLMVKYNWKDHDARLKQLVNKAIVIIWVVTFCMAIFLLVLGSYNPTGPACWIKEYPEGCNESWMLPPDMDETDCIRGDNATLYTIIFYLIPVNGIAIADAIIMCILYSFTRRREVQSSSAAAAANNKDMTTTRKSEMKNNFNLASNSHNGNGQGLRSHSEAITTSIVSGTSRAFNACDGEDAVQVEGKDGLIGNRGNDEPSGEWHTTNTRSVGYGNAPSYHSSSSSSGNDSSDGGRRNASKVAAASDLVESDHCMYDNSDGYGDAPSYLSSVTSTNGNAVDDVSGLRSTFTSRRTSQPKSESGGGEMNGITCDPHQRSTIIGPPYDENEMSRFDNSDEGNARDNGGRQWHNLPAGSRIVQQEQIRISQLQRTPRHAQRSVMFAQQGLLYIGGFLISFGFLTLSLLYFYIMGYWSPPIDRAGYIFMASQGIWNFMVFTRRRRMKTRVGETMKKLMWCMVCCNNRRRQAPDNMTNQPHSCASGMCRIIKERIEQSVLFIRNLLNRNSATEIGRGDQHRQQQEARSPAVDSRGQPNSAHSGIHDVMELLQMILEQRQQEIAAERGLPVVVADAEFVQPGVEETTRRSQLSSSNLREIIRRWLTEQPIPSNLQFSTTEQTPSATEERDKASIQQQQEGYFQQVISDLLHSSLCEDNERCTAVSPVDDDAGRCILTASGMGIVTTTTENGDETNTIVDRPGAFRIGRDGNPIASDDRESHLPSILAFFSSTATPHAQTVMSTSGVSSSCNSNGMLLVTEDDIIRILREQLSLLARSLDRHHNE